MASVFERNGRWYLRWRDESGRWVQKVSTARTKTEARRLAGEVEQKAERRRLGLEDALPADGGGTVRELMQRWLASRVGSPGHEREVYTVGKHLLSSQLAAFTLAQLRAAHVENFLEAKRAEGLSPQTVNHLRGFLSRAFNTAKRRGWWTGVNPIAQVQKQRIPQGLPRDWLRLHEAPAVLAALSPRWRPLFATAIYAGIRKGELLALRKTDVDLVDGLILVQLSVLKTL